MKNTKNRNIISYVLPSVGAMFVTNLYIVVDGIFVGQGVGAAALAAVNIAVPFTEIMTALASMIAIGGATVTAIRMGRGDIEQANDAFMTSTALILLAALLMTSAGALFPVFIARVFGASEALLHDTASYIRWYSLFSIFLTLSILGSNFARNDGAPKLAFWAMIAGALANIFLDWLFVFPLHMGIKGAAIASGLGQLVTCSMLATHFLRKKGALRIRRQTLSAPLCAKVLKRGLPELVVQLSQPITIFCYNQVILRYMGELGLSAFSAVSYLIAMIQGIFFGISQGLQPLIGQSFGAGRQADKTYYFRAGLVLNVGLSVIVYLFFYFFGDVAVLAFNNDPALIAIAVKSLKVYGLAFIPAAACIVYTTYFFSTKNTAKALAISLIRGVVLNSLCIFLIPAIFGEAAIWIPMLVAEGVAMLTGVILKHLQNKQELAAFPTGALAHGAGGRVA